VAVANAFSLLGGKTPASWLLVHYQGERLELTRVQGKLLSLSKEVRLKTGQNPGEALAAEIRGLANGGVPPGALALYGPAMAEPGILTFARQENLTVITPDNFTIQGLPAAKELQAPAYAAAGAAFRGLGKVPVGINLLPPEERAMVRLSGFSPTKLLLMIFLSLVVVWLGSIFVHKRLLLYQVDQALARVSADARLAEKQIEEGRALAKQLENLRRLQKSPDKLVVLKDLTQLIPDHTWLFTLRISQQNLEIGGLSRSAADLIPLLEKSGWLKKTEFASPIVTDASKLEHFKIKAEIKSPEMAP
jgi:general secretion pathway protein L